VRRALVLALALGAALAGACGRKSDPLAPELVEPLPPEDLGAIATPDGVRLSWRRPTRYSGGDRMDDLGGFTIERAPGDVPGAAAFAEIGRVTLDDQTRFRKERRLEWTDKTAARGERYRYRVTAWTLDGYRSAPAGPVAVQFGAPPDAKDTPG
jgi:hypothetical protein